MTNPTPHGQVPEALNQLFEKLEDCIYEWSNYVRADDAPTTLPKYTAGAIKDLRVLVAELYHRAAHAQNPAEIEHVAGDVSKNGAEANMRGAAYAPMPRAAYIEFDGQEETAWHTPDQMRAFADRTHALRMEQAAPNESAYQRGYMDGMAKSRRDAGAAPQQEAQEPVASVHRDTLAMLNSGQEGMLLRDYFAAQVVSAVFHGVFEDWRQNKAGIQEDWPTGIAVDAYRVADAMLKIREAT